jgi:tRNA threonylcarbamoyladenosine biosynthesis protein TsaE
VATPRTARAVELVSESPEATFELGERLARLAEPGDLLCLWGELGAGKTVFAKGFGRGLGVAGTVSSPSFILMAEHPARLRLFHLDLYRLADATEALGGGLLDERQADGVTLVEWPDRLGSTLPPERLDVRIGGVGDEPRRIRIETEIPALGRYVDAAPSAMTPAARRPAASPGSGAGKSRARGAPAR